MSYSSTQHPTRPRFLIAAASSDSGKTTVTMGLIRALSNRGLRVQPFKCGPDYIDPILHKMASGRASVNLDTYLASPQHVRELTYKYSADADISIIEGVMGLFDGYDKDKGSSAEIARLLNIPVILVVNAKSVAYSVAPLIYGFKHFDPSVHIAGVIFNRVASDHHFQLLRNACEDAGVACLGYMPRHNNLVIPGRHLGLTIQSKEEIENLLQLASELATEHIDLDRLISTASNDLQNDSAPRADKNDSTPQADKNDSAPQADKTDKTPALIRMWTEWTPPARIRILVAKDEAFNFAYQANIDALQQYGEVSFFSPMNDTELPPCDLIYLPGGYPELYIEALEANTTMRRLIHDYAHHGGHIMAECGGMMYLCQDIDGHNMCGVLPLQATMEGAHLHLGYRQMNWEGKDMRGHEFHYSSVVELNDDKRMNILRLQSSATGRPVNTPIYRFLNVIAGYTHWYWADEY